jgi:hypothetical protein
VMRQPVLQRFALVREQNKKLTELTWRRLVRNPHGFLHPVAPIDHLGAFF